MDNLVEFARNLKEIAENHLTEVYSINCLYNINIINGKQYLNWKARHYIVIQ